MVGRVNLVVWKWHNFKIAIPLITNFLFRASDFFKTSWYTHVGKANCSLFGVTNWVSQSKYCAVAWLSCQGNCAPEERNVCGFQELVLGCLHGRVV